MTRAERGRMVMPRKDHPTTLGDGRFSFRDYGNGKYETHPVEGSKKHPRSVFDAVINESHGIQIIGGNPERVATVIKNTLLHRIRQEDQVIVIDLTREKVANQFLSAVHTEGHPWKTWVPSPDLMLRSSPDPEIAATTLVNSMLAQSQEQLSQSAKDFRINEMTNLIHALCAPHESGDIPEKWFPSLSKIHNAIGYSLHKPEIKPPYTEGRSGAENIAFRRQYELTEQEKDRLTGKGGLYDSEDTWAQQSEVLQVMYNHLSSLIRADTDQNPISFNLDDTDGKESSARLLAFDIPMRPVRHPALESMTLEYFMSGLRSAMPSEIPEVLLIAGAESLPAQTLHSLQEYSKQLVVSFGRITESVLQVIGGINAVVSVGDLSGGVDSIAQRLGTQQKEKTSYSGNTTGLAESRDTQESLRVSPSLLNQVPEGRVVVVSSKGDVFQRVPDGPTFRAADYIGPGNVYEEPTPEVTPILAQTGIVTKGLLKLGTFLAAKGGGSSEPSLPILDTNGKKGLPSATGVGYEGYALESNENVS